ncbi:hypothetical protein ABBQ32_012545 [Trebouxia sp. C0010 RCD-2024]
MTDRQAAADTLKAALGSRSARLTEQDYRNLIEQGFDSPEALLDARDKTLEASLTRPVAVDTVLAWQAENKPSSADASIQHLGQEAVRRLLVEQYPSIFQLHGPGSLGKRQENFPLPNVYGNITGIGSFLGLQGYETVVQQIYRRLLRLNTGFFDSPAFARSLQLLRIVAAPGLGKSTVLKEVWTRLYQLAHEAGNDEDSDPRVARLNKRILSSLRPDKTMVFVLDLMRSDLQQLHPLEENLGGNVSGVLALRMLYSSVCSNSEPTYHSFLTGMDRRLRHSLEPLDVLYFWQHAGAIGAGTAWMAVFAVDEAVIVDLANRFKDGPVVPSSLPPQLLLLLQLIGGNPRMLSQALCLLAGSSVLHNEEFPAGHPDCWRWLQGDFHLIQVVDGLCNAMIKDKWQGWLASNDSKVNLMNQLVAHCVCRVPITRQQLVPGSHAAGATVTWQDMENDGVAYIGEPGQGLWSGGSGDSSSNGDCKVAVAAASEPGAEGVRNPDSETHLVSMPPVLLVAAYRFMKAPSNRLVWVPSLNHLTDDWRTRELTDVSILVAKLLFWHDVLLQPVVSLRELLGGIDVGDHEMSFCVPEGNFSVCDVSSQLTQSVELQSMVNNMDAQWAFRGPINFGPDSWLLLRRCDDTKVDSPPVVAVWIQSKKRQAPSSMQSANLGEEAAKMLDIPGVDNLMVYVTDQHRPICHKASADFCVPTSMVLVGNDCLPAYYSACIALLKGALSGVMPPKKRPRGA